MAIRTGFLEVAEVDIDQFLAVRTSLGGHGDVWEGHLPGLYILGLVVVVNKPNTIGVPLAISYNRVGADNVGGQWN